MLGVVWGRHEQSMHRDWARHPRVSVWLHHDSTNSSAPEFHLAPRRSRLGEIRHIARHGLSVQPERSGVAADRAWRFPAPPFLPLPSCPHSPCPESSGISSRKGCLGLTAPEHGRFHLVIFSQPTLMLSSLDRTLSFPSSNVSETWADLSDCQLVIYLVWVA